MRPARVVAGFPGVRDSFTGIGVRLVSAHANLHLGEISLMLGRCGSVPTPGAADAVEAVRPNRGPAASGVAPRYGHALRASLPIETTQRLISARRQLELCTYCLSAPVTEDLMSSGKRARGGDAEAFCELLHSHRDAVATTLRSCGVSCRVAAEDLAQEIALSAWTRLPTLNVPRALPRWPARLVARTEGVPDAQLARMLGVAPEAVRMQALRLRKRLPRRLDRLRKGDPGA